MRGRGTRRARCALVTGVVLALVTPAGASSAAKPTDSDSSVIRGAHDCVPRAARARGDARVAWRQLRNPVFALDHMTKDQTIRLVDGQWHLYYSERADDAARTGHAVSTDLTTWVTPSPVRQWDSPDLTRAADGRYVLTHQIADPADPDVHAIHASTAPAPEGQWDEPIRLVPDLFPGERLIDAALAHTDDGLFLMFKRGRRESTVQTVEVARSPSGSLAGPWEYVGAPDLPWSENYQLLPIDGVWHVLVTTVPVHLPVLYRLVGDPARPRHWLRWEEVRELEVPAEEWNAGRTPGIDHERANSAYLCDARRLDGYWYLFYAGSDEVTTFDGRGHARIGLARSKDLVRWKVPPGR